MIHNLHDYYSLLDRNDVTLVYSGPLWSDCVEGIGLTLKKRLEFDELPLPTAQSVFSVFVEQMNNMLMHSQGDSKTYVSDNEDSDKSKGIFVLGVRDKKYFAQSGNIMKNENVKFIKDRIDHLNTLDKQELRKFYKEQIKNGDMTVESKGAGLGLIEIARRSSSKIEYEFTPVGDDTSFFTMYVTIG